MSPMPQKDMLVPPPLRSPTKEAKTGQRITCVASVADTMETVYHYKVAKHETDIVLQGSPSKQ